VVGDQVGAAAQARDRGGEHDAAGRPLLAVLPERAAQPEEDAAHVDRHDPVEVGGVELGEPAGRSGNPRVEVMKINLSERTRGYVQILRHILVPGDVGPHRGALAWQLRGDLARRLAVEVDDDNPAPLRGQPPRGRGPDPASTTGHDRHFARKPAQH
jgi:hypothetical protein